VLTSISGKMTKLLNSVVQLKHSINSVWYLDIRASNHICKDEQYLEELTKVNVGHVFFRDDSKVALKGIRIIWYLLRMTELGRFEKCIMYSISKSIFLA